MFFSLHHSIEYTGYPEEVIRFKVKAFNFLRHETTVFIRISHSIN